MSRASDACSLPLVADAETLDSLNLESDSPFVFEVEDRASALTLAAHIAVAIRVATDQHQMRSALTQRTAIWQAEGMLMQGL